MVKELTIVNQVENRVKEFRTNGDIKFPPTYIPENALKSAWLKLNDMENKEGKKILDLVTKESVANSLLSMVVLGLNVDKSQGYFIQYGNKLVFQRSYFGSMSIAKRVSPNIDEITAEIVYKGDVFKLSVKNGQTVIDEHTKTLESISSKEIVACYAVITYRNSEKIKFELMTMDDIKQAWKQSKMYPIDDKGNIKPTSVHGKFTEDMCKKTVINKICKYIINTSDDSSILNKFVRESDMIVADAEIEEEIQENANILEILPEKIEVINEEEVF